VDERGRTPVIAARAHFVRLPTRLSPLGEGVRAAEPRVVRAVRHCVGDPNTAAGVAGIAVASATKGRYLCGYLVIAVVAALVIVLSFRNGDRGILPVL
jgi:hypothetical protein